MVSIMMGHGHNRLRIYYTTGNQSDGCPSGDGDESIQIDERQSRVKDREQDTNLWIMDMRGQRYRWVSIRDAHNNGCCHTE